MADRRRVVVTGVGVVSPAGIGTGPFWQALTDGQSFVKTIDLFDAGEFPCSAAGQLDDFSARKFVPKNYRKAVKVMARDIEIAVAAADIAFRDSGIVTTGIDPDNTTIDPKRLGCNIGAGLICSDLDELGTAVNTAVTDGKFDIRAWGREGINNLTPLWLLKYLPNMLSCHVTIIHSAQGPSNCITCGGPSGLLSVGESRVAIERGAADAVVAGGAESKLNPMGLLRQGLLNRLCTDCGDDPAAACRPFDASAAGTVIGEGGAVVILEDYQRAKDRGATIYAEVAGFAAACDPHGIELDCPNAGSLDVAVAKAVRDAGIDADKLGLIVAHGTGVPAEDACESAAWSEALGETAGSIPAAAITGTVGSLFAGSGAAELAAAVLAVHNQKVPATVNHETRADGCTLNFSAEARDADIEYAVAGGFSIGGQSGAVVLKRAES